LKIRNRAILLCGVPTSGKSSWVTQNRDGYMVVSSDNIIENYAKSVGSTYNGVFDDYIETAIELMLGQLRHFVRQGHNIIVDQTHLTPKVRKRKLKMIPDHYEKIAVYFEISKEEMFQRNHNEDRTKTIPDAVLESMHGSYVRPTADEGFLAVYGGEEFSLVPVNNLAQQQAISV
jgi:predicted kinase